MLNCTLSAGFLRWPNQGTDCPPEKPQKAVVPGRPGPKNEVFFFSFKGDFIFLQSALGDIAIASPRLLGVCSASRFRRSCMDPRTRGPWPPSTRWTSCPSELVPPHSFSENHSPSPFRTSEETVSAGFWETARRVPLEALLYNVSPAQTVRKEFTLE